MNLVIQRSGVMTEELKECSHEDEDEGIEELCCGLHHLAKSGHCVLQRYILRCWHLKAKVLFAWIVQPMRSTLWGMLESLTHHPTHWLKALLKASWGGVMGGVTVPSTWCQPSSLIVTNELTLSLALWSIIIHDHSTMHRGRWCYNVFRSMWSC